jgi:hypothetical protein
MYEEHRRVVCAVNAAMDQNCKLDVADEKREKKYLARGDEMGGENHISQLGPAMTFQVDYFTKYFIFMKLIEKIIHYLYETFF